MVSRTPAGVAVDRRSVTTANGAVVVARFHAAAVSFGFHVGSNDPPVGNVSLSPGALSSVSATELPVLLATFNGGFKSSSGAGGIEVEGHVLTPLIDGLASVVINTAGQASIGVWGQSVPRRGEMALSVRQNLRPLVQGGQRAANAGNVTEWGATVGGRPSVARSALGQDPAGNLLFAASVAVLPDDMASGLVDTGAITAMELDVNPEWVQLDVATTVGGALGVGLAGQSRPADQYLSGWTRDFFTVLARS